MRRFLLTNGLGGYSSLAIDFSAQADTDGVFVAAPETPEHKVNMVRRLEEVLTPEEPFALQHFSVDPTPCWIYKAGDVLLQRQLVLGVNENTCAIILEPVQGEGGIYPATEEYLLHTYNRYPIVLERGDGVYLTDSDGKRYLDFFAGIAVEKRRWS